MMMVEEGQCLYALDALAWLPHHVAACTAGMQCFNTTLLSCGLAAYMCAGPT